MRKFTFENRKLLWLQTFVNSWNICLTIIAGKILDSYILNGNLFQEIRILAARVARDDALPSQPITEPGQVTVTVEGVGQKVAEENKHGVGKDNGCVRKCVLQCVRSQRGQGVQSVKGSGVDGGDLVVVERQEAHWAQPDKAAVAHTADSVAPQHAVHTKKSILPEVKMPTLERRSRTEVESVMCKVWITEILVQTMWQDIRPERAYLLW